MRKKHISVLILTAVIMSLFRATVVIFNMETNLNDSYYLRSNFQTVSFTVVAVICVCAFIALGIYMGKGKRIVPNKKNNLVFVSSCMLSFMLMGVMVIYVSGYFISGTTTGGALDLAEVILAVLSAAAILAGSIRKFSPNSSALLVLAPLIWTVVRIINDFMKTNAAPLNSSGAYHILSLIFLVMYFLCEGKAYISKGSAAMYYIFGYLAVIMLSVYALPNVIMHCLGFFAFDYQASLSAMDMVICAYVISRMATCNIVDAKQE